MRNGTQQVAQADSAECHAACRERRRRRATLRLRRLATPLGRCGEGVRMCLTDDVAKYYESRAEAYDASAGYMDALAERFANPSRPGSERP